MKRGTARGFDLGEAVRNTGRGPTRGGETKFEQLSGTVDIDPKDCRLGNLRLASGLLTAGGSVGIVLPDGILGNPKDAYIRRWVLDTCDVLASIDLPVETFLPQVGVQPSLLFLRKKTGADLDAEALGVRPDRSVFMAIVDRVGKDRRGNVIFRRNPDGTDAPPVVRTERRTASRDGRDVEVEIRIEEPVVDDDLPDVLTAWKRYREQEGVA